MTSVKPTIAALSFALLAATPIFAAPPTPSTSDAPIKHARWCTDTPEACAKERSERRARWQAMSPEEREAKKKEARAKWDALPEADKALLRTHMEERLANMPDEFRAQLLDRLKAGTAGETTAPAAN